jgi:glucosamine--fructose-6-phosphate aminotransferase (isomerizing)
MTQPSPFEADIQAQPGALRAFAAATPAEPLGDLSGSGYRRIVLTGMGASHFAALPAWRRLTAAGHPAWWVSTTQLLDTPELVTPDTLLIATSQSGASGEITQILPGGGLSARPRTLVGVTNEPDSPLAAAADATVLLHSGSEATVSTKTYLNTLAAHQCIVTALTGGSQAAVTGLIGRAAEAIEDYDCRHEVRSAAKQYVSCESPRIALIGKRDHAATALLGGLILKEAAKVPAEGYIGGEFRHGPLEIAGPGLSAILIGLDQSERDPSLPRLARELAATGAYVLTAGDAEIDGCVKVPLPPSDGLTELAAGAALVQALSVELARAKGIVPGEFRFGRKITAVL